MALDGEEEEEDEEKEKAEGERVSEGGSDGGSPPQRSNCLGGSEQECGRPLAFPFLAKLCASAAAVPACPAPHPRQGSHNPEGSPMMGTPHKPLWKRMGNPREAAESDDEVKGFRLKAVVLYKSGSKGPAIHIRVETELRATAAPHLGFIAMLASPVPANITLVGHGTTWGLKKKQLLNSGAEVDESKHFKAKCQNPEMSQICAVRLKMQ
ncbi:hypothetical protein ABVT39_024724 [Epinephelus coioides]